MAAKKNTPEQAEAARVKRNAAARERHRRIREEWFSGTRRVRICLLLDDGSTRWVDWN